MDYDNQLVQQEAARGFYEKSLVGASNRRLTYREEIEIQIKAMEAELNRKKEMLALLDENPAIEKFMNLSRGI